MAWFREDLHGEIAQTLRVDEEIYQGKTDLQEVTIFRNDLLGKVLVLDGAVQVTELDEHIYSEMMVHLPVLSHPNPKDVLIVGGGDGTCLREAVRHANLDRVVLAELDGQLIDLCDRYMTDMVRGAFQDEKSELMIGDGASYIRGVEHSFDVIIVDSTDPAGPSEPLFTENFYRSCRQALKPGGILVAQAGCPMYQKDFGPEIGDHFKSLFQLSGFYQAAVPSYLGGLHAFAWASDEIDLANCPVRTAEFTTRYYSEDSRKAGFLLPL